MPSRTTIPATIAEFTRLHGDAADQLLPLLHFVQQAHGHIASDALGSIAEALNLSRAEVFGVVSFYDDFHAGRRPVVQICAAEACQALGCRALLADVRATLGANAVVTEVFCLGNCAAGPSARIGDRVLGPATAARINAALAATPDSGPEQ